MRHAMAERAKYKKKKIKAPSEVNDLYMPCTQDFHFKNEVTNGKSRPPSCLRMKSWKKLVGIFRFWIYDFGTAESETCVFSTSPFDQETPLLLYRLLYLSTWKFVACVNLGMPEIRALLFSDVVISRQSSILTQQNFNWVAIYIRVLQG